MPARFADVQLTQAPAIEVSGSASVPGSGTVELLPPETLMKVCENGEVQS